MIRLIVPFTLFAATVFATPAFAQNTFPAPLPGQAEAAAGDAVPPVKGAAPLAGFGASSAFPSGSGADACMTEFAPLREDAEQRGRLIEAARERRAPAVEACTLFADFGLSEIRMIKYLETNSAQCGISPATVDQLRAGHENTERMQKRVCAAVLQSPSTGRSKAPAGPVGDF